MDEERRGWRRRGKVGRGRPIKATPASFSRLFAHSRSPTVKEIFLEKSLGVRTYAFPNHLLPVLPSHIFEYLNLRVSLLSSIPPDPPSFLSLSTPPLPRFFLSSVQHQKN